MSTRDTALTLLCVLGICVGQVLFKLAAGRLNPVAPPLAALRELLLDPRFFAAMALYLSATLLWIWLLRRVPLGTAYAFMALAFVIVPLLAATVLGEALTARMLAGALLIVAGVYVVAS